MSNFILKLFVVLIVSYGVCGDDDCGMQYEAAFREEIYSCANFANRMLNAEGLKLSINDGDEGEGSMSMRGSISLNEAVKDGAELQIEIYKETDLANEFINGARWDICKNLQKKDAPWYPLLECLGVTQCPISAKEYPIENLFISLESVKDVLTHEFCGDYEVHVCIVDDLKKLSCHIVNLAIVEKPGENCKR